ncbi:DUF2490 domain-containing protein [Membranihabitans marinus]|uniref:DUF2490 domain-containing protein n=1 Tax=Membranihabitans marinus TaxID=1227546 RepID=UPI001F17A7B2|nr:DUF2490 domain-containing protein [Membranihabitans marinus]
MKTIYKIAACLLLTLILAIPEGKAQEGEYYTTSDFELWTGARLKYKINKLWSMNLEHEYRFKDDASVMDQNFTELGVKRNIGDQFSIAVGGRYIRNNDTNGNNQGIENHFRWNADLGYKTDIERFTFSSRFRYQQKNEFSSENPDVKTIRLKAALGYNIKKWKLDPEFATEIFNETNSTDYFDKIRFTLSTSYNLKKYGEISGFYRLEKELVGAYPKTSNIIGIRYQYTIKNKKK